MDVENFGIGSLLEQLVTHRMDQMGFAQAHPTVNKQGVVKLPWHGRHMHRSGTRHPVSRTLDQTVERQSRIEPIARSGGCVFFNPNKCFWERLHFVCITHNLSPDLLFFRSDR